jgi:FkbM family methyltransferase
MLLSTMKSARAALDTVGNAHASVGFSQFGEDQIILPILQTHKRLQKNGFYVDVGCFHPFSYSNTALLHLHYGWRGINIDANPEVIELFNTHRPQDTNLHAAISDEVAELEYSMFNHGGVNTLDPATAQRQATFAGTPYKLLKRMTLKTRRLDEILSGVKGVPTEIDLLSVDCEGLDDKVLASNDWQKFRPFLVVVETHGMNLNNPNSSKTHVLLAAKGYSLVSHAFVTSVYMRTGS